MRLPHLGHASAAFGSCVWRIWVMRLAHLGPSPASSAGSSSSVDPFPRCDGASAVLQSLLHPQRQIGLCISMPRTDAVKQIAPLEDVVDGVEEGCVVVSVIHPHASDQQ